MFASTLPAVSRRRLLAAVPALAAATLARPALAAFPDRSLRIISPFNPGGVNDIIARALAQPLSARLGQSVVVENRAGAGGGVGALAASRATPDGLTMLLGIVDTQVINPLIYPNLPYNPSRDFAPVSQVTTVPLAIVVGPSRRGITDLAGLVRAAKADPGGLTFASWGIGSTSHLGFARVMQSAGIDLLHVPFTGQAPAMQAIAASQVDAMAVPVGGAEAMSRDGSTRILAVLAPQRLELLPNVPTLKELGTDLVIGLWQAVYVPPATPAPIIAQLNTAVHEAMQAPSFIEVLRVQACKPEPGTAPELAAFQEREKAAWGETVARLNIRLD